MNQPSPLIQLNMGRVCNIKLDLFIKPQKPSFRGLFFLVSFLCASILPVALFGIGYKAPFVSKELVLLGLVDLFFVYALMVKQALPKLSRAHCLVIFPVSIICLYNYTSPHLMAVCILYLLLFVLVAPSFQIENLVLLIAWSAMIATLSFSFI